MPPIINIVIIDANFILLPFQFKIDYLKEIRDLVEGKISFIIFRQVLKREELALYRNQEP